MSQNKPDSIELLIRDIEVKLSNRIERGNIMQITSLQLGKITGLNFNLDIIKAINQTFKDYGIDTNLAACYFLANVLHESSNLTKLRESMNYSAERLLIVFPKYYKTKAAAVAHGRKQREIANTVYANRMGNGNYASGDGYKYRGGGAMQTTGKNNYTAYQKSIAHLDIGDVVKNPDDIATMPHALLSAGYFWKSNNLNDFVIRKDFLGLCQRINGSGRRLPNGWADRESILKKAKAVLGA